MKPQAWSRRDCLLAAGSLSLGSWPQFACAGGQLEEAFRGPLQVLEGDQIPLHQHRPEQPVGSHHEVTMVLGGGHARGGRQPAAAGMMLAAGAPQDPLAIAAFFITGLGVARDEHHAMGVFAMCKGDT